MTAAALLPAAAASDDDRAFMAAAFAYGRRWLGATGANPAVGAVVVREGAIVGRGATRPGGRPHAETEALNEADQSARGATLYVTLEPCSHHGATPPCAEAIIRAGVSRVVSALEDPDPRVSGRGHCLLAASGIETIVGVDEQQARRVHRGHICRTNAGRPMVSLKLAETADGYAAGADYDPRLRITGAAADNRVQMLRFIHDAIMVGAGTALADDPLLTVRLPGLEARRPLRVIVDTRLSLPLRSRLVATARHWPTLVFGSEAASESAGRMLREAGVVVERIPAATGGLDLAAALRELARRGVARLFCEGGPTLASRLLLADLADELTTFHGLMPLAREGLPALDAPARAVLAAPGCWRRLDRGFAGVDRWERFERVR